MAAIVLAVIIAMAVVLGAGELENKADPTTTTYTPRPEWYFYFLFELLRVIKPAVADGARDGRHPDDRARAAPAAAVLRPQSRAPAGAPADRDHRRRSRRSPRWPTSPTSARTRRRPTRSTWTCRPGWRRARTSRTSPGAARATSSARPATPGPGPDLTHIGVEAARPRRSRARCATRRRPMPSYADLPPEKFDALVEYLAALR